MKDEPITAYIQRTKSALTESKKLSDDVLSILDDYGNQLESLLVKLEPVEAMTRNLIHKEKDLTLKLTDMDQQLRVFDEAADLISFLQGATSLATADDMDHLTRAVEVRRQIERYPTFTGVNDYVSALDKEISRGMKQAASRMQSLVTASSAAVPYPVTEPLPIVRTFPDPVVDQLLATARPLLAYDAYDEPRATKGWLDVFIDIRRHMLKKSVHTIVTDIPKDRGVARGLFPLALAVSHTRAVLQAERGMFSRVLGDTEAAQRAFRAVGRPVADELISTVDMFVSSRKNAATIMFTLFDVHSALKAEREPLTSMFDASFEVAYTTTCQSVTNMGQRAIASYGDHYRHHMTKSVSGTVGVHELTISVVSFLIQLVRYRDVVTTILPESRSSASGLEGFIKNIIFHLHGHLQDKAAKEAKGPLGGLFLVNNHTYALRHITSSDVLVLAGTDFVATQRRAIDTALRSAVDETTADLTRSLQAGMVAADSAGEGPTPEETRKALKRALCDFTSVMEAVYSAQKGVTLADAELKSRYRQMVSVAVVPAYTSLLSRLEGEGMELDKPLDKHIKYRPSTIEEMIVGLCEG